MVRARYPGVVALMLATSAGCGTQQPAAERPEPSTTHTVVYQLESAQPAGQFIFYIGQSGQQEEVQPATLPWSKTFEVDAAKVTYLRVNAAVQPPPGALEMPKVFCRLTVDGKVVRESTGSQVVECDSSLPPKD